MGADEAVRRYYDACQDKRGDFSEVRLAEDFVFTGPVASFDSADGYRAMAREAGRAPHQLRGPPPVRRRRQRVLAMAA